MSARRLAAAGAVLLALLAVYSTVLLATEWNTSQQFVRNGSSFGDGRLCPDAPRC